MIVGIDLGTTNSLVTVFKDGKVVFIPNQLGEYLTPSIVSIENNEQIIVGKLAKERLVTAPTKSFALFKRAMGSQKTFTSDLQNYTPEQLSSFVIRQLIKDAERFLNEPIKKAVISVPAYFNSFQRSATKKAGELAGVEVDILINEPSAAALACRAGEKDESFIIFDFGGGTLDVSIVESFLNIINISTISGDNHLGGSDFDQLIVQLFCKKTQLTFTNLSKQNQEILLRNAEYTKMNLGFENEDIEMTATIDDIKHTMIFNNQLLYDAAQPIFKRMKKVISKVINDSGLTTEEISKCILVGGSCSMAVVQRYLQSIFKIEIMQSDNVDQVVAKGLGIYTGIKMRDPEVSSLVLTDICPYSLGTTIVNHQDSKKELTSVIIPRNTTLPVTKTHTYTTVRLGQTKIELPIIQGESYYGKDNLELGSIKLKVPFNKNDYEQVEISFTYDINATLVVESVVLSTGEHRAFYLEGNKIVEDLASATALAETTKQIAATLYEPINLPLELLTARANRMYQDSVEPIRGYISQIIARCEQLGAQNHFIQTKKEITKYNQLLDEIDYYKPERQFFAKTEMDKKIIDISEVRRNEHMGNFED